MKQTIFLIVNLFLILWNSIRFFSVLETTNQPAIIESKDRILHTTKTVNEPIVTVKGDYGQGTPADQHLYTTRGVSSLDPEKKIWKFSYLTTFFEIYLGVYFLKEFFFPPANDYPLYLMWMFKYISSGQSWLEFSFLKFETSANVHIQ